MAGTMRIDMESSRQSGFIKRTLAAAVADGSGNPRAFAFPAVHNLRPAARRRPRPDAEIAGGGGSQPDPPPPQKYPPFYLLKKPLPLSHLDQLFSWSPCPP